MTQFSNSELLTYSAMAVEAYDGTISSSFSGFNNYPALEIVGTISNWG